MALTAKKVYAILKRQISNMEAKIKTPIIYRGTVATADLLPLNPDIGDMYNIESKSIYGEAGMNVAWNGVNWDTMGAPIDMSLYIKSSELADWVKQQNKPTYTAEEVGALPADTKIPSKTSDLQNDSGFLTKIPDNYLSGTDKTLSVSGKAADAKATGDKIAELSADISNKLNKNQGSENSGKIAGINESGDIVPMFPVSVDYNEETNCLEFGSDQKMELNKGINLDSTLTKTGYAADAGAVGEITNSLKEDIGKIIESSHNIPRLVPKDITSYYNDGSLWKRLEGSGGYSLFEDLIVGDYFKMSRPISAPNPVAEYQLTGSQYVTIASLGGLAGNGDNSSASDKWAVMVPGAGFGGTQHFGGSRMNPTNTTEGAYKGSEMNTKVIGAVATAGSTAAEATINQQLFAEFGSHLKTTRELITNSINTAGTNRLGATTGCSNNYEWLSMQAVLMSEIEVYGSCVFSSSGYDTGTANHQLELFANSNLAINNRSARYWLKDAASATDFCICYSDGHAGYDSAIYATDHVRPRFIIGA